MQIVSYITDSFQEYDGEHSLVLFSKGCNLDCCFCYNKDKMNGESIGDAIELIDKLITPLHTAVVLCGGEPTIWHDLHEVCKHIKEKGLKCKLFTNAINCDAIRDVCIYNLINEVSIDFKCYRVEYIEEILGYNPDIMTYVARLQYCRTVCKNNKIPYEFRTTFYDGMSIYELDRIKSIINEWTKSDIYFKGHIIQDDFRENLKIKMEKLGE